MYIFGYGSLINRHSRLLTSRTGEAVPAIVNGLQRIGVRSMEAIRFHHWLPLLVKVIATEY